MRDLVEDLLPDELLTQPKRGFILPLSLWTRTSLRSQIESALNPEVLKQQGYFSEALWTNIVRPHMEGRQNFTEQIWTLFMFQKWQRATQVEVV
jgi:asparagine synthase (glutamine-hydrolysing)